MPMDEASAENTSADISEEVSESDQQTIVEKSGIPKQTGSSSPTVVVLLTLAMIGGAAGWFYWRLQQQPDQALLESQQLITSGDTNQARLKLTRLAGLPQYELPARAVRGAMLVSEGQPGESESLLARLPDENGVRSFTLRYRGISRFRREQYEAAEEDFQESLDNAPENEESREWLKRVRMFTSPTGRLIRGTAAIDKGDRSTAEQLADSLQTDANAQPHWHLLKGLLQIESGELDEAMSHFAQSGQAPELRERSLLASGKCLDRAGQHTQAIEAYSTAVLDNNDCAEAHFRLASWYYKAGTLNYARAHLETLARLRPEDPRPSRMLGTILSNLHQCKLAIPHFEAAINAGPDKRTTIEIYLELAECLIEVKRFSDATKVLSQDFMSEINTDDLRRKRDTLLARCKLSEGYHEEALDLLDNVLVRKPDYLEALIEKGEVLRTVGKIKEAIKVFELAAEYYPMEVKVQFRLRQVYRRDGQEEKAAEADKVHMELAGLTKRLDELRKIVATDKDTLDARFEMGTIYARINQMESAKYWFGTILAIDPTNPTALSVLDRINSGKPLFLDEKPDEEKDDSNGKDPRDADGEKNEDEKNDEPVSPKKSEADQNPEQSADEKSPAESPNGPDTERPETTEQPEKNERPETTGDPGETEAAEPGSAGN